MINKLWIATGMALVVSGAASAQTAATLSDPQIANVAYTADQIDIAAAKQALAKSRNRDVRAFANEMVRDHTAVNDQALALVKKLKVTPQPNPTSASLLKQAAQRRQALAKLRGTAFDRAYAMNEVTYHQAVINALSTTLIPDAQNAELKSLLTTGLKLFQEHEQHAEHLVAGLK